MVTLEATNSSMCVSMTFSVSSSACYVYPSYMIACAVGINIVLGFPANCYILWLSAKEMIRGQSTEIFVVNEALTEVIFCSSYASMIRQYFFNCTDCRFGVYFPGIMLLVGRPLFQSCICLERYLGVLHPVMFLKLKPMKYRIACSAVGWIVIISSSLIVTMRVVEFHVFMLPILLFFLSVKLYSCSMVLKALLRPGPSDNGKQKDGINRDKIRAFWIILTVLVSSVIMYGPLIVSLILIHIIELEKYLLAWSISLSIGIMSGFVQPVLYLKRVSKLPFC
nr:P2Y purinoceptor 8-like [Misgurnus anguillicaudatus]